MNTVKQIVYWPLTLFTLLLFITTNLDLFGNIMHDVDIHFSWYKPQCLIEKGLFDIVKQDLLCPFITPVTNKLCVLLNEYMRIPFPQTWYGEPNPGYWMLWGMGFAWHGLDFFLRLFK
jgi:hypothetical protein